MAQHKWAKAAAGTGIDGVVASSDATNISSARCWLIVLTGVSRDETLENIRDIYNKIAGTSTAFPGA